MRFDQYATLITGATGYLGSLVAATLLAHEVGRLVLLVRNHHSPEGVLRPILAELEAAGRPAKASDLERVQLIRLPATADIDGLHDSLRSAGVRRVVHCAGCVDYFDRENLVGINIDLTRALLELSGRLDVERFHYMSTAFSSGFSDTPIPEKLHATPLEDPTDYTWSKREAERVVADSGVPWVIHRPSVVVGDSRDGRYAGKRYGIYQFWHAAERLMCARYIPVIHAVAPQMPFPLVHQDAFQSGFLAAYRHLPAGSIVHLVLREERLPTVRDLWNLWLEACARPREVFDYDSLAEVPMERLDRNQRVLMEFAAVNLDISLRRWQFSTDNLDLLRATAGLKFRDATAETVGVCQSRFIAQSPKVQEFLAKFHTERSVTPRFHSVCEENVA